jgi:hypothetical protein
MEGLCPPASLRLFGPLAGDVLELAVSFELQRSSLNFDLPSRVRIARADPLDVRSPARAGGRGAQGIAILFSAPEADL